MRVSKYKLIRAISLMSQYTQDTQKNKKIYIMRDCKNKQSENKNIGIEKEQREEKALR